MPTISNIRSISNASDTLQKYIQETDAPQIFSFQKKNLIYGYNGSGKTTISRIFQYLGSGVTPLGLGTDFNFEIVLSNNKKIKRNSDLSELKDRILVYNEDYIEDNFNWNEGSASPILGLGKEQIENQQQLSDARRNSEAIAKRINTAKKTQSDSLKAYKDHSTKCAKEIGREANITRPSFTASSLQTEYSSRDFSTVKLLSDEEYSSFRKTASQKDPPEKISEITEYTEPAFDDVISQITSLLEETAKQARLAELDEHPLQEKWVETGYAYHDQNKLEQCLFCGETLSRERYEALANHFSEAVNDISKRASQMKDLMENIVQELKNLKQNLPRNNDFVETLRNEFDPVRLRLEELIVQGHGFAKIITQWLNAKLSAPASFLSVETEETIMEIKKWQNEFTIIMDSVSELIGKHNEIVGKFENHRMAAQNSIRDHLLARDYEEYKKLKNLQLADETALKEIEAEEVELTKLINTLETSMQDHASAAYDIDREVGFFLYHRGITMTPTENGYQLTRADGSPVVKLSEGEKTAITFCYFIITLPANNRDIKDLIVVVDDPISSLDTRALSYMSALVRDRLANVKQLFVLTHNISFMMEMRKWIVPKRTINNASEAKKERKREIPIPLYQLNLRCASDGKIRRATLENMSNLIRDYEGEYHYLYSIVFTYAEQDAPMAEPLLLLPNAIRKVLETFLAFKAPSTHNLKSAIEAIKAEIDNPPSFASLERFADIESHGDNISSLTEPAILTIEEAHPVAIELIKFIGVVDERHHKMMKKLCKNNPVI